VCVFVLRRACLGRGAAEVEEGHAAAVAACQNRFGGARAFEAVLRVRTRFEERERGGDQVSKDFEKAQRIESRSVPL